jgi:hypothetical protein
MNHTKVLFTLLLLLTLQQHSFCQDTLFMHGGSVLVVKVVAENRTEVRYHWIDDAEEVIFVADKMNVSRISYENHPVVQMEPLVQDSLVQTYKRLIKLKLFGATALGYEQLISPRMSFEVLAGNLALDVSVKTATKHTSGGFVRAGLKLMPKPDKVAIKGRNPLASEYLRLDVAYGKITDQYYEVDFDTSFTSQSLLVVERRQSYALMLGGGLQFNFTPRFLGDIHFNIGVAYSEVNSNTILSRAQLRGARSYYSHNAGTDDFALAYRFGWTISYLLK